MFNFQFSPYYQGNSYQSEFLSIFDKKSDNMADYVKIGLNIYVIMADFV